MASLILIVGPSILAACRAPATVPARGQPPPATIARPLAEVETVADNAYPAHSAITATADVAVPTVIDPQTAARELLPEGAVLDWVEHVGWYGPGADGAQVQAYGLRYTLKGRPSVAVLSQSRPMRLQWDLRDHPELMAGLEDGWPLEMDGTAGLAVRRSDETDRILILNLGDPVSMSDELSLPSWAGTPRRRPQPRVLFQEHDVTGDGRLDPVLDWSGMLLLYERLADGGARLIFGGAPGAMLVDRDRDGIAELTADTGPLGWYRSIWRDGGFQELESMPDPDLPAPVIVAEPALPSLPGELTYVLHGERAVRRWPREGGSARTLWRDGSKRLGLRGLRVSRESGDVLVAVASGGDSMAARLILLNQGAAAQNLPTLGELRDFQITADGRTIVYTGLGVDPAGRPLDPKGAFKPSDQGAVFAVEGADPGSAREVARCETVRVSEYIVDGCHGALALSMDGLRVAYGDGRGLRDLDLAGGEPRLLVENYHAPMDGPGGRRYSPISWSPDDRRLLVAVAGYEGSSPAVIDLAGGAPRDVPVTSCCGGDEQVWLSDGASLLATRWGFHSEGEAEVRVVDAAAPEEESRPVDVAPVMSAYRFESFGPAAAANGGLRFGLRQHEAAAWPGNGVFRSERDGSGLRRLADVPALTDSPNIPERQALVWSPDGAAFVVRFSEGDRTRTLVGLADGSALWDARAVLGEADWITWSR